MKPTANNNQMYFSLSQACKQMENGVLFCLFRLYKLLVLETKGMPSDFRQCKKKSRGVADFQNVNDFHVIIAFVLCNIGKIYWKIIYEGEKKSYIMEFDMNEK